ncbi:MAG: NUDIX hydrolase [Candidatus Nanoarchaeia archaeon]|nr:NUDIX hydrolase [Candidatus Nanoarchaeia archaeon]
MEIRRDSRAIVYNIGLGKSSPLFLLLLTNNYSEFPGGRCNESETYLDCVIREASEELRINKNEFTVVGNGKIFAESSYIYLKNGNEAKVDFQAFPVLMNNPINIKIGELNKHIEWGWWNLDQTMSSIKFLEQRSTFYQICEELNKNKHLNIEEKLLKIYMDYFDFEGY